MSEDTHTCDICGTGYAQTLINDIRDWNEAADGPTDPWYCSVCGHPQPWVGDTDE